jgi:hypothetical protein
VWFLAHATEIFHEDILYLCGIDLIYTTYYVFGFLPTNIGHHNALFLMLSIVVFSFLSHMQRIMHTSPWCCSLLQSCSFVFFHYVCGFCCWINWISVHNLHRRCAIQARGINCFPGRKTHIRRTLNLNSTIQNERAYTHRSMNPIPGSIGIRVAESQTDPPVEPYPGQKIRRQIVQEFLYDHIIRSNNIVCVSFSQNFIRFRLKDTSKNLTRFLQ